MVVATVTYSVLLRRCPLLPRSSNALDEGMFLRIIGALLEGALLERDLLEI